jgi:myosin-crossreactive antigen
MGNSNNIGKTFVSTCGYGNIIATEKDVIFTSQHAINCTMENLFKLLDMAITDLSRITNLDKECVIQDYISETGIDILEDSFKAVAIKNGVNPDFFKTLTRMKIDDICKYKKL